ncbi:MAG: hypothetical protein R3E31_00030 [Chloroflexota bacterium]
MGIQRRQGNLVVVEVKQQQRGLPGGDLLKQLALGAVQRFAGLFGLVWRVVGPMDTAVSTHSTRQPK